MNCECGKPSVTRDGRNLCQKCLKKWVTSVTPMVGCYRGMYRTSEQRQAISREQSPWQENAVRALEGE